MNPTLQKVAAFLPTLMRNIIPVPSGPGYVLELEGSEIDALQELAHKLQTARYWERYSQTEPLTLMNQ